MRKILLNFCQSVYWNMYLRLKAHAQLCKRDNKAYYLPDMPTVGNLDMENVITENACNYQNCVENDWAIRDTV